MTKKYLTEILCISCSNDYDMFYEWLYWHIVIIGFQHIVIIDNSNTDAIKRASQQFEKHVKYIKLDTELSQSDIYTEYANKSESYWVLPIDDDEFVYVSNKYSHNINNLIFSIEKNRSNFLSKKYYKFSISWMMMFSNTLYDRKPNGSIFNNYSYYNKLNNFDGEDFLNCKTMVNTMVKHLWCNDILTQAKNYNDIMASDINYYNELYPQITDDHIGSVHNPITIVNGNLEHAYNLSNNLINPGYKAYKPITGDEDCLLLHFKYRSKEEWDYKCNRRRFNDIIKAYYNKNYTDEKIINVYKQVESNLIYWDKCKEILNYYV